MSNNAVSNVLNGDDSDTISNCAVDSKHSYIVWDTAALWNKAFVHTLFLLQLFKTNWRGKNLCSRYILESFV